MNKIDEFKDAIERARGHLSEMVEVATSGDDDAMQAMLELAQDVQDQVMRAIQMAVVSALSNK